LFFIFSIEFNILHTLSLCGFYIGRLQRTWSKDVTRICVMKTLVLWKLSYAYTENCCRHVRSRCKCFSFWVIIADMFLELNSYFIPIEFVETKRYAKGRIIFQILRFRHRNPKSITLPKPFWNLWVFCPGPPGIIHTGFMGLCVHNYTINLLWCLDE
jgi:hypothetical protein